MYNGLEDDHGEADGQRFKAVTTAQSPERDAGWSRTFKRLSFLLDEEEQASALSTSAGL